MSADKEGTHQAKIIPLRGGKCPICKKPAVLDYKPFCSKRCADLDLGRWLDGAYRLPTNEAPGDAEAGDEDDEFNA